MKNIFIILIIALSFYLGYSTCQSNRKNMIQRGETTPIPGGTSPKDTWKEYTNKELIFKYPDNLTLKEDETHKTVALKEADFQIPLLNYLWGSDVPFFVYSTDKNAFNNLNSNENLVENYIKTNGLEKSITAVTFYKKEMVIDGQKSIEISGYLTPLVSNGKSIYIRQLITQDTNKIYNFVYIMNSDTFTPKLFDEIISTIRFKNK